MLPESEAAALIAAARLSGTPLGPLPPALRPADEAAAYRVQARVHERLTEAGWGARQGYKIGCTTAVMQRYLGIASPCAGGVFAGGVHRSGATLPYRGFVRVGIECEIAVRLGRDLTGAESLDEVGRAVDEVMPAIEIVDDRYADWRATDTPTLIADDFFAAGCVLGAPVPRDAAPDLAAAPGRTLVNGVEVGRGAGADVMGHPHRALAWLAGSLAARGLRLRAGEIVLTGSLVQTVWLSPGDRVEVSVGGLGEALLTVAS